MKIANLRIAQRLTICFGVVCALLVIMVALSNVMLGRINAGTKEIVHDRAPKIEAAGAIQAEINDIAIALRNMLLFTEQADQRVQMAEIVASRQVVAEKLKQLDSTIKVPRARELLTQMVAASERYTAGQDELIRRIQAGQVDEARLFLSELRPVLVQLKKVTAEQAALQKDISNASAASAQATFDETRLLSWGMGGFGLLLAGAVAWWITASITRPVNRALDIANTVAAGDLTSRIDVDTTDEMGRLLQALKTMNENLASTVGTVRAGTETIATAAAEVAAGNQDLSSRTEQQASSLEETASSMEELTSTVKQNADNARQANVLANAASSVAQRGGEVIGQVTGTMEEINASATKIADIIGVIDGIAFQTNILALNAAVEAARAGEQGRGFAVVASEVRNLAQRSASAAREIKELIGASTEKVSSGSRLVTQAGETMQEIVQSVQRVTDIMAEITSASTEQTAGIEQINQAIVEMDSVTQQNAALVEQAAAASESMQDQAAMLAQAVAVFRIGSDHVAMPAAPAKRVTPAAVKALSQPAPVPNAHSKTQVDAQLKAPAKAAEWEEF